MLRQKTNQSIRKHPWRLSAPSRRHLDRSH